MYAQLHRNVMLQLATSPSFDAALDVWRGCID